MNNIDEIRKAKPNDEFEFTCAHCGKTFKKTKAYIRKISYHLPKFCSKECSKAWKKEKFNVQVNCEECGKELVVLKSEFNKSKSKHFFCNNSCAAKYNNSHRKRKSKERYRHGYDACPICGKPKYYKSKTCSECRNKRKRKVKNRTLGFFIDGQKYLTIKCSEIRKDARKTLEESTREKVCGYCHNHEFDAILEVHHIKGILELDKTATIEEINDEKNLIWLCPNHHKMLEMGLIELDLQ